MKDELEVRDPETFLAQVSFEVNNNAAVPGLLDLSSLTVQIRRLLQLLGVWLALF